MYRWFLAHRFLLQRPINLLGVIGVMLGVWALIVVVAIFSGYIGEVRSHIRATTADVSIFNLPPDCSFARVRAVVETDPNVAACAPRVVWSGMLHPTGRATRSDSVAPPDPEIGEDSRFLHLIGIDPAAELGVSGLSTWLAAPQDPALRVAPAELLQPWPPADADGEPTPTLLLSERRAALEGLPPGSRAQITVSRLHTKETQSTDVTTMQLVLQGVFASKYVLFDASTAILHIDSLRHLLGTHVEDACNVVAVKLRDPTADVQTAARLERALKEAVGPGVYAQNWEETNAMFLSAVDHQRSLMKLILFAIMVVAAFLMFATLSMMVTEKEHDIGILSAMGATRLGVLQVFLSCGLAIVAAGTLLGILLGCLSAMYLDAFNQWLLATFGIDLFPTKIYNLRHVPYQLDPAWIAQVATMALGVGVLVSGVPAWRASRHDPVDSLRTE